MYRSSSADSQNAVINCARSQRHDLEIECVELACEGVMPDRWHRKITEGNSTVAVPILRNPPEFVIADIFVEAHRPSCAPMREVSAHRSHIAPNSLTRDSDGWVLRVQIRMG